MRRLTAMLLAVLAAHSSPVAACQEGSGLVGVWRFQKEVNRRADGTIVLLGPADGYEGMLVYTANGYVSVQINPKGRTWDATTATHEQLRATAVDGTAYYGRYTVDAATHTVTHLVQGGLDPAYNGRRLARSYSIKGDELTLAGTLDDDGAPIRFEITWSREP